MILCYTLLISCVIVPKLHCQPRPYHESIHMNVSFWCELFTDWKNNMAVKEEEDSSGSDENIGNGEAEDDSEAEESEQEHSAEDEEEFEV